MDIKANSEKPNTDLQHGIDEALDRWRQRRQLRPIVQIKAWEPRPVQLVTAEEVWFAWRRFKIAQERALAGGSTEDLLELHDDFTDNLKVWLSGPAA